MIYPVTQREKWSFLGDAFWLLGDTLEWNNSVIVYLCEAHQSLLGAT